jgi:hypothetical protein
VFAPLRPSKPLTRRSKPQAGRLQGYVPVVRNATHELIGVSLALAAGQALEAGAIENAALAAAAVVGARLPDLDQLGARVHTPTRLERWSLIIGASARSRGYRWSRSPALFRIRPLPTRPSRARRLRAWPR